MTLPKVKMTLGYITYHEKLLMIHRNQEETDIHYNMWIVPEVRIEEGELPIEGIRKELEDQVGINYKEIRPKGFVLFNNENRTTINEMPFEFNTEVFVYSVTASSDNKKPTDDSGNPTYWVPIGRVYDKPMHAGDKKLWQAIQNCDSGLFEARIVHKKDKLDRQNTKFQFL
jgi:ADP-ribose pyrophosphatase YjhB (NUDIX family)